jgi:hypothetical protein
MTPDVRDRAYGNPDFLVGERVSLEQLNSLLPEECQCILVDEQNLWECVRLPGRRLPFSERGILWDARRR